MAKKKIDLDTLPMEKAREVCPEYGRVVKLLEDNDLSYNHVSPALRDKNNGKIIEMWKSESDHYCEKVLVCRNSRYVLLQVAGTFAESSKEKKMSFAAFLKKYNG